MAKTSRKLDDLKIVSGFTYTVEEPRAGCEKGDKVRLSAGETIPVEVMEGRRGQPDLEQLIQAQKVAVRQPNGNFEVDRKTIVLKEAQVDKLLQPENAEDLMRALADLSISRMSLMHLHARAEQLHLPADVIKKIEMATLR